MVVARDLVLAVVMEHVVVVAIIHVKVVLELVKATVLVNV
jgi:hypothetical protein